MCFPPENKLHKLLNRNNVKLSYSCMPNMERIISAHNKFILKKSEAENSTIKSTRNCNCKTNHTCPVDGKCLTSGVIYQATVTRHDNAEKETYIGLTENSFKTRYNGHVCSLANKEKKSATTLSEYIWKLKDGDVPYSLKWSIISKAAPYSTATKKCNLCTEEKFFITYRAEMSSLNKRNELVGACRHRKKHLLRYVM